MEQKNTYVGSTFSMKNRVGRILWSIVYSFFFRFSPKPFHAWRSFLLKCFGAKIGKSVHVYPGAKIWAPWNLELADEAAVANGVILYTQGKVTIGKRAVISQGAHLCSGSHDYNLQDFPLYTSPIVIGDYVWVAAEAFIHPGIIVSEGCVIGARSVVTKDMPAWMVCAGHPCKPIKARKLIIQE
jgi:putative colanic acid biosynthesis acetyltransferase WcaF